jgi:hypothetical protein
MDFKLNTLQYLTEPSLLEKINKAEKNTTLDKDIEFYKKRIYLTTKNLLRNKKVNSSVDNAFNEYVATLIKYFKITDTNDILQEEFKNIQRRNNTNTAMNKNIESEANEMIMNNANDNDGTLNTFVKTNKKKEREKIFMPEKKRINLKDPNLKDKGIYNQKRK